MGWNDGTEQEIFTIGELIDKFSLGKVQRAGARFDERRLLWMNGAFIRPSLWTSYSHYATIIGHQGRGLLGRLPPRRAGAGAGAPEVSGGIAGANIVLLYRFAD